MKTFLSVMLICAFASSAPTLRVVLAIDTMAAQGAGIACRGIGDSLDRALEKAARDNNITYDRVHIDALKINQNNLYKHYAYHPVNKEDTVLFYYCGHGLMHPGEEHIFDATGGRVARAYIRKMFSFLPAKLKIIATETCSSYSLDTISRKQLSDNTEIASDLLFNASGTVDITAASPGQTAWYDDHGGGGMFTNALIDIFQRNKSMVDQNGDGRASWAEAFPFIRSQTNTNFLALKQSSPIWNKIQASASQDAYSWKLTD